MQTKQKGEIKILYPAVFSRAKSRAALSRLLGENRETPMIDFTEHIRGFGRYGRLDEFMNLQGHKKFQIIRQGEVLGLVGWNEQLKGFYLLDEVCDER